MDRNKEDIACSARMDHLGIGKSFGIGVDQASWNTGLGASL